MYRILIVEDNEINQRVLLAYLANKNIKLTLANNGVEALEFYKNSQYDCILMDIAMPEMDGIQATKQIRNIESKSNTKTPIIAVTASDPANNRDVFDSAGFNDFVAKPINPFTLIKKIKLYSKIRF